MESRRTVRADSLVLAILGTVAASLAVGFGMRTGGLKLTSGSGGAGGATPGQGGSPGTGGSSVDAKSRYRKPPAAPRPSAETARWQRRAARREVAARLAEPPVRRPLEVAAPRWEDGAEAPCGAARPVGAAAAPSVDEAAPRLAVARLARVAPRPPEDRAAPRPPRLAAVRLVRAAPRPPRLGAARLLRAAPRPREDGAAPRLQRRGAVRPRRCDRAVAARVEEPGRS